MTKYILNIIHSNNRNDASTKPKSDINYILKGMEFKIISQRILLNKWEKLFKSIGSANKVIRAMHDGDLVLIHYPSEMGRIFDYNLMGKLKRRNVKTIALIHDVNALRSERRSLRHEVAILNKFSYVISPNENMTSVLRKNGLQVPTTNLEVFDYLSKNKKLPTSSMYSKQIVFTGNLDKSLFIHKLSNYTKVKFKLYGPISGVAKDVQKIYQGSYDSDVLLQKITSGFGLIWDGNSCTTIDNTVVSTGSYLEYNNPHKLSFYIAAGIPIFIWEKAAEASFVQTNKIGYSISSISDIDKILANITEREYRELSENIGVIQGRVLEGYYTTKAVTNAIRGIE